MILKDELFDKFIKLVYKHTGIHYEANKKYYVQKRLEKQMEHLGLETFSEYYQLLKFNDDKSAFEMLVNDLTVNETYFFRDFPQLRNFAEDVLPLILKDKERKNEKRLKIWSAACSTGEEPYTLSIILQEMIDSFDKWNISILASDINTHVLNVAKAGLYESRQVKDVPDEYFGKYFTIRNGKYLVNLNVRKGVNFRQINLMDEVEMSAISGYDFIFCRNCLIYFDDDSKKEVVQHFYESLNPGGFIFLGHSESVGRISSAFKLRKIGDTIVYSKPE